MRDWILTAMVGLAAAGAWAGFFQQRLSIGRARVESDSEIQNARNIAAWRRATSFSEIEIPFINSGRHTFVTGTFMARRYWVKSYQAKDVQPDATKPKYGVESRVVSTILCLNDRLSMGGVEVYAGRVSSEELSRLVKGAWKYFTLTCRVERLESGEWVPSDYQFMPLGEKPEFLLSMIKDM